MTEKYTKFCKQCGKEVHRSVTHNLETGKGMYEINNLTIDFLIGTNEK